MRITPPPQVDPAGVVAWWATVRELLVTSWWRRLRFGAPHVAMEYRWVGRALTVVVWLPGGVPAAPVAAAASAAWPGCAVTVGDADNPVPADATAAGGVFTPVLPGWYPLQVEHGTDPMRTLIAAGAALRSTERACVQVLARPATAARVRALRRAAAALRAGRPTAGDLLDPAVWLLGILDAITGLLGGARAGGGGGRSTADPVGARDAGPAIDKAVGPLWEVAVRYAVTGAGASSGSSRGDGRTDGRGNGRGTGRRDAAIERRLGTLAQAFAAGYGVYGGRNRLRHMPIAGAAGLVTSRRLRRGFLLSAAELAALAGLPTDIAVAGLERARAKAVPAPVAVPSGGRGVKVLGRAEVGGHAVGVPVVDARQHLHVLGATGSGKSTQLCHMVLDDVRAGRGVVLIDPKGDLALDVLDRLPASIADKVVLIDPDQPDGATFNPLEGFDDDLVVDNVVAIFSKIFQRHWGPRIDDVMRVACLTLMRRANATLTLVPPLLNSKQFRAQFTADLDDPEGLRGFWEWYESTPATLRAQVIGPVLARLRSLLLRDFVRRTIGTPRSSFDMGRVLDGGLLIARLPKGQLGEETAKLMGSFVFASVWQAATARSKLPEARRRDAVCYVDEAHNVLNLAGSVGDMLAEARGYHLSLVLAHQTLSQLPRELQLALSANARNKLIFACSPEDSHQLARHTLPELDEHDLTHLDRYTAAVRLVVDAAQTPAFTLRTRPPLPVLGETTALRQAVARAGAGPERNHPDGAQRRRTAPPSGVEQLAGRAYNSAHDTTYDSGHDSDGRTPHAAER
ncbi:type IV secretory system conjugative DNA transfer family protein [Dactylosporangium aurantiacum]|uniref:type IV secretory system conjugative DNA transfer family protein n=1 Tax=Dactylosporangium aurantiacum TaxID=35754 RepID=UPI0007C4BF1E|nr:type IV secretion system DNA-binding domain-containing protein [Dactylosporangium aurantiacum]MDG6104015.1 type IV secretion system DNA-binding domain-containing protein [Dactylosporangium aurantiacum]